MPLLWEIRNDNIFRNVPHCYIIDLVVCHMVRVSVNGYILETRPTGNRGRVLEILSFLIRERSGNYPKGIRPGYAERILVCRRIDVDLRRAESR